jgi:hypothetical protein
MSGVDIISVHVPKCAGVSLRQALEVSYGRKQVYRDYGDLPADPTSPMNLDPEGFFERARREGYGFLDGKKVVHGHFNIRKYEAVEAKLRITFLRHPLDRTISHYFFWQTWPRRGHKLHDYVLDNRLDLQDFARLPLIAGFYHALFFAGVDMRQFDFIGFHESLERDYASLRQLIGLEPDAIPRENTNADGTYRTERERVLADKALMRSLRESLRDEIAFYEALREEWA